MVPVAVNPLSVEATTSGNGRRNAERGDETSACASISFRPAGVAMSTTAATSNSISFQVTDSTWMRRCSSSTADVNSVSSTRKLTTSRLKTSAKVGHR
jgi:hypothetical protein